MKLKKPKSDPYPESSEQSLDWKTTASDSSQALPHKQARKEKVQYPDPDSNESSDEVGHHLGRMQQVACRNGVQSAKQRKKKDVMKQEMNSEESVNGGELY